MRKGIILVLLIMVGILSAQESASFGFSTSIQTSETNNSGNIDNKKIVEILENLNYLQYSYLKKLSPSDYNESVKILDEVRALLGKKKVQNVQQTTTSVGIEESSSQSVNMNINISGFNGSDAPAPAQNSTPQPVVQQVEAKPIKKPMDSGAFERLVKNIQDEAFAEDQLRYVRSASNSHNFSVNQIGRLIDLFTFSEEKIDCLRITYPKVTDEENGFELINKFTFEDEKESAEQIISQ